MNCAEPLSPDVANVSELKDTGVSSQSTLPSEHVHCPDGHLQRLPPMSNCAERPVKEGDASPTFRPRFMNWGRKFMSAAGTSPPGWVEKDEVTASDA